MIDMHGYQVVPWQIEIMHSSQAAFTVYTVRKCWYCRVLSTAVQRTAVLVVVLLVLVRAYGVRRAGTRSGRRGARDGAPQGGQRDSSPSRRPTPRLRVLNSDPGGHVKTGPSLSYVGGNAVRAYRHCGRGSAPVLEQHTAD